MQTMRAASTSVETSCSNRNRTTPGAIWKKTLCIFCDAEISGCSRCSCYPVVPPLDLLRTSRPGPSSTLRSHRSLRSLARCAATKRFSNILKINEKSINITTKRGKRRARDSRAEKDHLYVVYIDEIYLIPISAHTRNRYQWKSKRINENQWRSMKIIVLHWFYIDFRWFFNDFH